MPTRPKKTATKQQLSNTIQSAEPLTGTAVPDIQDREHQRLARLRAQGFKPGQSGNPSGRPKKAASLREIVKSWADKNAGAIEKELDHHVFKMHRWDALQWALEWNLGKPAVTVERTSDEKQLAYAELQVKLLEVMAKRNGVEVTQLPAPRSADNSTEIPQDTHTS